MTTKKYPGQGLPTFTGEKQTDNRQQNSIFITFWQGRIYSTMLFFNMPVSGNLAMLSAGFFAEVL